MDYQVWIKEEFDERYTKVDCGDLPAAKREIDKAVRAGREPILTLAIPYELSIKTGEPGSEVKKRETKSSKDTRPESESEVRLGDTPPVQELDK